MKPKLTLNKRVELINKVKNQELTVVDACRAYGISRTIFYRLIKRYEESQDLNSLKPKKAVILVHPRKAAPKKEQRILEVVSQKPDLSSRKLAEFVSNRYFEISEKGTRNIFHRYGLNTFEKRLIFARRRIG